jgi:hypothetical protein
VLAALITLDWGLRHPWVGRLAYGRLAAAGDSSMAASEGPPTPCSSLTSGFSAPPGWRCRLVSPNPGDAPEFR